MKKAGWIIGIILASVVSLLLLLAVAGRGGAPPKDGQLSAVEAMALSRRGAELYCAGVYYTDKALSADPEAVSYDTWRGYVDKADEYWKALDEVTRRLQRVDGDTFEKMARGSGARAFHPFFTDAYAYDSKEILRVFDSAQAGKRLKAVAEYLGKDMKYAQKALQVANGQITAEEWNNFADTAQKLEAGARVLKTGAAGAAIVASAPASGAWGTATAVVGGANWLMQAADDGCFILMGDKYDSSEFVAQLNNASDTIAPVAGAMGLISMDFSNAKDAVLSTYEYAENLRALFQEGKVLGIQLGRKNGRATVMTQAEFKEYRDAREKGYEIEPRIRSLLDLLERIENEPTPGPAATPKPTPEQATAPDAKPTAEAAEPDTGESGSSPFSGAYYAAAKMERCDVGAEPDFHYEDIVYTFYPDGTMTREELEINGRYEYFIQYFIVKTVDGRTAYVDEYDNLQYYIEASNGYLYLIQPEMGTVQQILQPAN